MKTTSPKSSELIEFPAQNPPIAIFFAVVPLLTLIAVAVVLLTNKFPLYLVGLLLVVAGGCAFLVKLALEGLGPVTLEMTQQELVVKRMLGASSYPWSNIESVKAFNPGPTFSNSGRGEDSHAGLGLFLRNQAKGARDVDAEPDVLLVSVPSGDADKITKACNRLELARRKALGNVNSDPRRGGAGKPTKGFRRPAAA
jgi:hypothetical protein